MDKSDYYYVLIGKQNEMKHIYREYYILLYYNCESANIDAYT
jgi:hypothetical protein